MWYKLIVNQQQPRSSGVCESEKAYSIRWPHFGRCPKWNENAHIRNLKKFTHCRHCIGSNNNSNFKKWKKKTKKKIQKLWKINRQKMNIQESEQKHSYVCRRSFFSFAFSTFIYFVFLLNIYITMRVLRTVSPSLCNQSYKEWVLVAPYKVDEVSVYFVQSPNFIFISNFFFSGHSIHPLTRRFQLLFHTHIHTCGSGVHVFNFHRLICSLSVISCFCFFILANFSSLAQFHCTS